MLLIDKELELNKFSKLHLICGEEYYMMRSYKKRLINALSNPDDDMNKLILSGKEADEVAIADFGNLAPFMAPSRLIVVEDSGFFSTAGEKAELKKVIDDLPETTFLIFVEKNISKNVSMYKWFQKKQKNNLALITECEKLDDRKLGQFIAGYMAKRGKKITKSATQLLLERIGNDMTMLSSEMDKIIGYVGDEEAVKDSDIEAVGSGVVVSKVFEMIDAVSKGDENRALSLYRDLVVNKEKPLGILTLLGRQYVSLYRFKTMQGLTGNDYDIAAKIGTKHFKMGFIRSVSRRYDVKTLENILEYRAEIDQLIKTSDLDEQVAVEMFLIKALTNHENSVLM
ncbi:MAG: DNA polymerase III subunit delta [Eubacterium sp.]|nr:DNA polymerase III subunit delta [Eubacterium sp.]